MKEEIIKQEIIKQEPEEIIIKKLDKILMVNLEIRNQLGKLGEKVDLLDDEEDAEGTKD